MNHQPRKVSSPIRSVFVKQWERTEKHEHSSPSSPIVLVQCSAPISFAWKDNHNKEKIRATLVSKQKNRCNGTTTSTDSSLTKTSQLISQRKQQEIRNIDGLTENSVLPTTHINSDWTTLSRSNTSRTIDSTCSSTSNLSSPPRFARPTIASIQKQRQFLPNSTPFKRINSLSRPITTFTRTFSSVRSSVLPLSSIKEDLEQQQQQTQTSKLTNYSYSSNLNLVDHLSTSETTNCSIETVIVNRNLPLKYKRDSLIRLYG